MSLLQAANFLRDVSVRRSGFRIAAIERMARESGGDSD